MAVLAVCEYQRIDCGDKFDPENRLITEAQHRALERFSEDYKSRFKVDVLQHGPRRSLVVQNFVGVISLGKDQIEVLPKIEGHITQVRQNLVKMIASVFNLNIHFNDTSFVDKHSDTILEILIRMFCEQLWQAVRQGMVRRYVSRQENLPILRGRLSITNQIRLNLARPDRLACEYDEFNENNCINHVLKAALKILQRVANSQANQRHIAELLCCFDSVDTVAPSSISWKQISTDRLSIRYKPIIAIARLFIEGNSPDITSGKNDGFALLFDMNKLFEGYIGSMVRQVFGCKELTISLQGPKKHLASYSNGSPAFELRPDIVVSGTNSVEFVIDTKWKQLKEGASREGVTSNDAYQMYAYASKYGAPDVVLLYPHHGALGQWLPRRAEYWLNAMLDQGVEVSRRISVSTINLQNLESVPHQLRQIFPSCVVD